MKHYKSLALSLTCTALIACGGGETKCSTEGSLFTSTTWSSNGTLTGGAIKGKVNVPLTAIPTITGIPASCQASKSFSVSAAGLPAGLSLNAQTGAVTGTPTVASSSGGTIVLKLPGYTTTNVSSGFVIAP